MTTAIRRAAGSSYFRNPWPALWAMMVGFFMIMLDSTVVAIANPTIMAQLRIGYATVVWVTSAYLLAYAVPMLVAGRLGDRFGPKNLYLIGLGVFTVASLGCGLSSGAGMLIAARVVQGVGAGLLTPQTLSTITRIFPAHRRGVALGAWGTVASVASLVGPLAGGALVDSMGWEWIFFVNVPVGVIGLILAAYLIPALPHHPHRFDWFGVGLSGAGMFLIVFGLQQGQSANWQPWIWAVIVGGIGFMSLFVYWQARNAREPLIPLEVFNDRNFSLSNLRIAIIAFAGTGMMLPVTFYAQAVCGLSPTHTAVLFAPTAIVGGVLAPFVGMIIDRSHPLCVLGFGFSVLAIAMTWLLCEMAPGTPIWRLVLPFIALGVAGAFVWSPLTVTATRNLRPHLAGASSGVFNAVRQLGAVLGSASMAEFMTSRIAAEMPGGVDALTGPAGQDATVLQLPEFVRDPSRPRCRNRCCCPPSSPYSGSLPRCSWLTSPVLRLPKSRCPNPMATLTTTTMSSTSFVGNRKRIATPSRCGRRARQRPQRHAAVLGVRWRSAGRRQPKECPQVHQAVGRGRQILSQQLRAHYNRGILCPTDRDVEPIPVEQERDSAWNIVGGRGRHRDEDHRCLPALEFVDGAYPYSVSPAKSGRRQPPTDQRHLGVVRREHKHIGSGQWPGAVLVGPRRAEQLPQLGEDRLGLFGAFDRIALVVHATRMHPRGIPVEAAHGGALGVGTQPALVGQRRHGRAHRRVHPVRAV